MAWSMSITMDRPWRGGNHEFSNVYTYKGPSTVPSEQNASDLIDEVVTAQKLCMDNGVTFKRARVWGPLGDPATSKLVFAKDLSGTGSGGTSLGVYGELAVLVQWPLTRGKGGVARRLRKWLHSQHPSLSGFQNGYTTLSGTAKTPFSNFAQAIEEIGTVEVVELCAPNGDVPIGPPVVYNYYEHRQFGR